MGTVLIGWELGGGLGHVSTLLEVARALADRGYAPVLAVKDLVATRALLAGVRFPVVPAPVWMNAVPVKFRAASMADVLAIRGYDDPGVLGSLVEGWQSLLHVTRADLVIADYSPTLLLAASGAVPAIQVGSGFTIPPTTGDDFPTLNPGAQPTANVGRLLEVVQEVQRQRGRPVPATLPELFAGSHRFVHTFPELDVYGPLRRDEVVAPLHRPPPPVSPPAEATFFAYLGGEYPGVNLLLPHLAAAGLRGSAYLRNAPAAMVDEARRAGVTVYDTPQPLAQVMAGATTVLHHGTLGTATAALAAGRPQVMLPPYLETELTARAVAALGVGRSLTGSFPVEAVSQALREVMTPGGYPERALALAHDVAARGVDGCLNQLVECCQEWLS